MKNPKSKKATSSKTVKRFWQIMHQVNQTQRGIKQAYRLGEILGAMKPKEVAGFHSELQKQLDRANTNVIREAADIVMAKRLDDVTFCGFCTNHLLYGEKLWNDTLEDPGLLAMILTDMSAVDLGDVISNIAAEVYKKQTGKRLQFIELTSFETVGPSLGEEADAALYQKLRCSENSAKRHYEFNIRTQYQERDRRVNEKISDRMAKTSITESDRQVYLKIIDEAERLISKGQGESATVKLNEALRLCGDSDGAYKMRGDAWRAVGQTSRAIEDYSRAIELNPYQWLSYVERAEAYAASGDPLSASYDWIKWEYFQEAAGYLTELRFPKHEEAYQYANKTYQEKKLDLYQDLPVPFEFIGYCETAEEAKNLVEAIKERNEEEPECSEYNVPGYTQWRVKTSAKLYIGTAAYLGFWLLEMLNLYEKYGCGHCEWELKELPALTETEQPQTKAKHPRHQQDRRYVDFQAEYLHAWLLVQDGHTEHAKEHLDQAILLANGTDDVRARAFSHSLAS